VFFWIVPSLILQEKGLSVGDLNKRAVPVVIQNFMKNCFEFQG
jgi:hypothetical protein